MDHQTQQLLEIIMTELHNNLAKITKTNNHTNIQTAYMNKRSLKITGEKTHAKKFIHTIIPDTITIDIIFIGMPTFEHAIYLDITPYYKTSFFKTTLIDIQDPDLFDKAYESIQKVL